MKRFVEAPLSEFDSLFPGDENDTFVLEDTEYPPACRLKRGSLRFVKGPGGGLMLHVERCRCEAADFRVRWLFETGTYVFGSVAELALFWRTSVAVAFGLEPVPADDIETDPQNQIEPEQDPPNDLPHPEDDAPAADDPATARAAPKRRKPKHPPNPPEDRRPPRSSLTVEALVSKLSESIFGQEAALERVASVVVAQMSKRRPTHPGCIALLGPTSVGKTATVELLPAALSNLGIVGVHLFRVDCNELSDDFQKTRFLGAPPGYIGFTQTTPLFQALEKPRCILLLDEIEKAHPDFVQDVLLNLLDRGRLTTPDGRSIVTSGSVIALTTNLKVSELELALLEVPRHDRWVVQQACRSHMLDAGLRPELVARIGAFALYAPLDTKGSELAADKAIRDLASEYELRVSEIDPIVTRVVLDIAGSQGLGARAFYHAARELLAGPLIEALATGVSGKVVIAAGPPLSIRPDCKQPTLFDLPVPLGSVL